MEISKHLDIRDLKRNLENRTEDELWALHGLISAEIRAKGYARSKNLTAERGERLAIRLYNRVPGAAKLQLAPPGTKNVDAISRGGERYSIKTVTLGTKATGTFQADDFMEKRFEYLVIVVLDDYFQASEVLEATWEHVNRQKRMHKTMKAYNVHLNADFKAGCRVVYRKQDPARGKPIKVSLAERV